MTKIIAELSGNHGGDLLRCLDMIRAAKECGCWAAKFQFYMAEHLPDFDPKSNIPVPLNWLPHMFAVAKQNEIELFASVFHIWAVEELKKYTKTFKIASPESTRLSRGDYDRLNIQIGYGNSIFVSSGQQDWNMMRAIFGRRSPVTFLYCVAGYPATITPDDLVFSKRAEGFSDHTDGIIAPLAMIGAGAKYIEKHFKLDDNCVDAKFSLFPNQMQMLCDLAK